MAPPMNSSKDDDLPSDGRDDDTNPMATGTYKAEVTTMPDANTFRPLVPATAGGGNASSGASFAHVQFPKRPLLELHKPELQVMKVCQDLDAGNIVVSRDKLEDETIEFDSLLKYFLVSTMALTGLIATTPALAGEPSVQDEVKMVEAMSTFLNEQLGNMSDPSGGTPEEQAHREEIRTRYYKRIEEIKKRLVTRRGQSGWWV